MKKLRFALYNDPGTAVAENNDEIVDNNENTGQEAAEAAAEEA